MKIPAIDKQAHFWWGWAIAATLYPIGLWFAILTAALVGAGKEVWDKRGHGTLDIWDFAATALGGVVGAFCCLVLTSL
jgi:hypothetical protein